MTYSKFLKRYGKPIAGVVITTALVGTITTQVSNWMEKPQVVDSSQYDKKDFISNEVIVQELKENLRVNVMDVYLKSTTSIDKSPINFEWFKNIKDLTFHGKVSYNINVEGISEDAIKVSDNDITIFLSKPELSCELLLDRTEVKDDQGWLVLNNLEVTPEEMVNMERDIKGDMLLEAEQELPTVQERAEDQIKFLVSTLTKQEYNVKIVWT